MRIRKYIPAMLLFVCLSLLATHTAHGIHKISVVPQPVSMTENWENSFVFPEKAQIYGSDAELTAIASSFADGMSGKGLPRFKVTSSERKATVRLYTDPSLSREEYVMNTTSEGIVVIKGGSGQGVWWGLQTLEQILAQSGTEVGQIILPTLSIVDEPLFSYRGALLDCCRYFFTVDEVKSFIDMISLHKINTFHWHLTDDQGWRIEILKYPLLTTVGSVRNETLIGNLYDSGKYDGTPYGGYYTQEQIRDVVAYAAARQVTVVPEIEMPGHAQAALTSYPWLGCVGKDYQVATKWGISKEIFCVGKDTTLDFLENVLDEVCDLFPGEYINIGGDEAPHDRWEECPHCQDRMRDLGLENEAQLHSYLVNHIEKYLAKKGRKIIGWEEIIKGGGVSSDAVVMSWLAKGAEKDATEMGNDVIMAPHTYVYLDYYQTDDPKGNGEAPGIGGYISLEKCYSFDPFAGLDEDARRHIKGVQANMWTEYISDYNYIQHMMLPRLAALAEVAWSQDRSAYPEFVERVREAMLPVYVARGYRYGDYAFKK